MLCVNLCSSSDALDADDLAGDHSDLAYSGRGEVRRAAVPGGWFGLFSMLRGFFFSRLFGIHVRMRVVPKTCENQEYYI